MAAEYLNAYQELRVGSNPVTSFSSGARK
jgi:hypothetical protein